MLRHNLYKTYSLVLRATRNEGDRVREATAYASGFTQSSIWRTTSTKYFKTCSFTAPETKDYIRILDLQCFDNFLKELAYLSIVVAQVFANHGYQSKVRWFKIILPVTIPLPPSPPGTSPVLRAKGVGNFLNQSCSRG